MLIMAMSNGQKMELLLIVVILQAAQVVQEAMQFLQAQEQMAF